MLPGMGLEGLRSAIQRAKEAERQSSRAARAAGKARPAKRPHKASSEDSGSLTDFAVSEGEGQGEVPPPWSWCSPSQSPEAVLCHFRACHDWTSCSTLPSPGDRDRDGDGSGFVACSPHVAISAGAVPGTASL